MTEVYFRTFLKMKEDYKAIKERHKEHISCNKENSVELQQFVIRIRSWRDVDRAIHERNMRCKYEKSTIIIWWEIGEDIRKIEAIRKQKKEKCRESYTRQELTYFEWIRIKYKIKTDVNLLQVLHILHRLWLERTNEL